jgi:hypothetical protein
MPRCSEVGVAVSRSWSLNPAERVCLARIRPVGRQDATAGDPLNLRGDVDTGPLAPLLEGVVGRGIDTDLVGRALLIKAGPGPPGQQFCGRLKEAPFFAGHSSNVFSLGDFVNSARCAASQLWVIEAATCGKGTGSNG